MCPAHTGATREHVGTGTWAFHSCSFVPRAHLAQRGCRGPWGGCSAPFLTGSMRSMRHAAWSPYSLKHPVRKVEASLFTDDFDAGTEVVRRQQARVPAPWCPLLPRELSVPRGAVTEQRAGARVPSWTWEKRRAPPPSDLASLERAPYHLLWGERGGTFQVVVN